MEKTVYNIIPLSASVEYGLLVFYSGLIQLSLLTLLYITTYGAVDFLYSQ